MQMPANPRFAAHHNYFMRRPGAMAGLMAAMIPKEKQGYPASVLPEHKFRQTNEGEQQ
jgi:hypothetical protein